MRLCFVDIARGMGLWDGLGSAAARLLVVSEAFKRSGRMGCAHRFRPTYPDFLHGAHQHPRVRLSLRKAA